MRNFGRTIAETITDIFVVKKGALNEQPFAPRTGVPKMICRRLRFLKVLADAKSKQLFIADSKS